jgi:Gluconate 2-dehydrogenase subunit 3
MSTNSKLVFERRALLKMFSALPAAAMIPTGLGAATLAAPLATPSNPANAAVGYQPKVLNPHEWKTVHLLSDWIIPADDRSGSASEAGVPEFIDDWLDFKRGELLDSIRGGLTWLDLECNRAFRKDFADCTAAEQKQLLDRIAYPESAAPADASAAAFFSRLRDLVVSGFFTSEMGLKDLPYLGNEPQAAWQGCPAPVLAKLGLAEKKANT